MTALLMDRPTDQLGTPDTVIPQLLYYPVEANTTIYGGALVAINGNGNAVPASASASLKCIGRCERQVVNTTQAGVGAAGAISVTVRQGVFFFNCPDSSITAVNVFQNCYAVDDNDVSLSDAGGTRPYAGVIIMFGEVGAYGVGAGQVGVYVGAANAFSANPEEGASSSFRARAVVTSLPNTYTGTTTGILTGTANAGLGTQDGVTVAAGDVVLLPAGTTHISAATDAGPYTVTQLGSGSLPFILSRPDWWPTGGIIPNGASIDLGGAGTLFKGSSWKSFSAQGTVIDTTDPALYPKSVTQQATLVTGSASVVLTNVPVLAANKSNVQVDYISGAAAVTTVGYASKVITPGAIGTASVTVFAMAAGMTAVGSGDVSVVNVTIVNG
jgi:hypothetical protein